MTTRQKQMMWGAMVVVVAISLFIGAMMGGMVGVWLAGSGSSSTQTTGAADQTSLLSMAQTVTGGSNSVINAVNATLPAVVTVLARTGTTESSGSGFFISQDGYIVTNSHVIEGAQNISIVYAKGGQAPAKLIGSSPEFDVAVLQVSGPVPAVARWGDSSLLPLGAPVVAIGSALGEYRNSVTAGILSGFNRQIANMGGLLQTDAAINQGNSGGPLINANGEVVGINTIVVRGNYAIAEGLGFAIPSNTAKSVVRNLIENGDARHPFLGIQYEALNPQLANSMGLAITEGAVLQTVIDSTPAARAGLQAGDVIVALNGRPVDDRNSLVGLLLEHVAGETITLDVLRSGKIFQTQLTLGERA
jgi:2-alkenal reductase